MSDNTTTSFPTVGEDIASHVVNVSGQPSRYTTPVARKNTQSGGVPGEGAGKGNKGKSVIRHANGPACTIIAKIAYPNAEGSNMTLRNLRRVGGPGFRAARGAAANTGNV